MDLARVPGVTPESKAALESSGVRSTADLARVGNLAALAAGTGIETARLDGLREAARARVLQLLRIAGIGSEAQLAAADPHALASSTGILVDDVLWFQSAAREALTGLPGTRVVLRTGDGRAVVRVEGDVFEGVPVVAEEGTEGDVVVVRSGADRATARVGGTTITEVPIFAEHEAKELRVRVAALRTGAAARGKGWLGRFRKKMTRQNA